MPVISCDHVRKDYRLRRPVGRFGWIKNSQHLVYALRGVSFTVERGESVSILGPNGAGKTTLIKILSGVLVPTDGRVRCLGSEPARSRRKYTQKIGVLLGQKSGLIFDLPLMQSYAFLRAVYGLEMNEFKRQVSELTELLEIKDLLTTPVRKLSLGQRMRAELVAALLHSPELLFLDEPTIGLDLLIRDKIHEMVRQIRESRNLTVILTTHNPRDIEAVTERAIVLEQGVIGYDGRVEALRSVSDTRTIRFRLVDPQYRETLEKEFGTALSLTDAGGHVIGAVVVPSSETSSALGRICSHSDSVDDIDVASPSLEEAIKRFYQERKGGARAL